MLILQSEWRQLRASSSSLWQEVSKGEWDQPIDKVTIDPKQTFFKLAKVFQHFSRVCRQQRFSIEKCTGLWKTDFSIKNFYNEDFAAIPAFPIHYYFRDTDSQDSLHLYVGSEQPIFQRSF